MILLWSSLSLKHLAGTIKAVLVQKQPYVHLSTEVSFPSAEVFAGTSVRGGRDFPDHQHSKSCSCQTRAEPDSSPGTISARCCSKGFLKKEHFCHLHGCWGQFAAQPTCTGAAGAVPQPGSLGFPELERIALDKLCKVWVCVAVRSVNRCPLFCGAVGEILTAFL